MPKATPVRARPERPNGAVPMSSEAWLLMIPRSMWDVLEMQASAEGRRPGEVLDDAIKCYIQARGSDDVRAVTGLGRKT